MILIGSLVVGGVFVLGAYHAIMGFTKLRNDALKYRELTKKENE